jgi:predicted alpha/beta hydrolase
MENVMIATFAVVNGGVAGLFPLICVIAALVLFGLAAFWAPYWNRLIAAGLFCLTLALLIYMAGGLT